MHEIKLNGENISLNEDQLALLYLFVEALKKQDQDDESAYATGEEVAC